MKLPRTWDRISLKEIVGENGLFTDGDWILSEHLRTGKDVRLIQLADIGIGKFLDKSEKYISMQAAKELKVKFLQEGDVLISRMAYPIARSCILPKITNPCITAVDVTIARTDETIAINKFLMHCCNTHLVLNAAEAVAVGTTRKRVSRKNLEEILVPLPPLNEQRRIVAKLEKLLAKVDTCKERLDKIPAILKRFRQSVLSAACSGRLTADWRENNPDIESAEELLKRILKKRLSNNKHPLLPSTEALLEMPKHWCSVTLDQLSILVTSGSRGWAKYYAGKGAIFIRAQDINTDQLKLEEVAYVNLPEDVEGTRGRVKLGDLLITATGANVAKTALVDTELPEAYVSQHVALVRLVSLEYCQFIYLWVISYSHGRSQLLDSAYGAGKPGLNLDNIRELVIAFPPLPEQQEIVRRVQTLFKTADRIEQRYQKARTYIDQLTQSILAKAFRGELVPQDPNDEPASVLLERIRTERENRENVAKTAKKPAANKKPRSKKAQPQLEPKPQLEPIQLELPLFD